ncbi:MAG: VCBS repeat-containing protein, partial [Opitutaceae bacterium]|nr:VCBS repeat-containing protein [Opitutaceae bacterium]
MYSLRTTLRSALTAFVCAHTLPAQPQIVGDPWKMHIIDNEGRGSDGTKLMDINGDGLPDITTAWEEDGSTRVYLNPGPGKAHQPWPKVMVGRTPSAEDALFVDLDGDGRVDVVTATEGKSRRLFVHWAPPSPSDLLESPAWIQATLPATVDVTHWMYAQAMDLDGRHGIDLVVGGKAGARPYEEKAGRSMLAWLESPSNPRELAAWKLHPLVEAGWIMSIESEDMDGDGDRDILYSDRYGITRGVYWLENPGSQAVATGASWKKHTVGAIEPQQIMFLRVGDWNGDKLRDIVVGIKNGLQPDIREDPHLHSRIMMLRRLDATGDRWTSTTIPIPANAGNIKGVAIGDIDQDGRMDIAVSSEGASGARIGVYWLKNNASPTAPTWDARNVAGAPGIKFDLVHLLDLDADGDLDILTNEEREGRKGLGV